MSTPLLEIEDLHARVAGREIIKGFNLTINEGEVHAIMGPNGAGKSTLSYLLSGKPGYEVTSGTSNSAAATFWRCRPKTVPAKAFS